ncbi:hypothetical protein ABDK00_014105 [Niabella insulamsoli]|uniref:hypothetical protein n=1 Tax=Niabella insulamsoli TaxID=3144874 RepID=UPI0031FBE09C
MNPGKIAIVGSGHIGKTAETLASISEKTGKSIAIVQPEYQKVKKVEIFENLYANQNGIITCSGRHEYREYKGQWICHCGKILT